MILELFKVVVKDKISTKKSCKCLFLYLVYIQSTCLEEYLFSLKKKRDEQIFRWFWGFLKSQLNTKYKKKVADVCFCILFTLKVSVMKSIFPPTLEQQFFHERDEQIFKRFWSFIKS